MSELIKLQGMANTRDLGGMVGADGRKIVKGKLIRSGHLHDATQADIEQLSDRVGLVVDFRTEMERDEKPNPAVPGAEMLHLPAFESFAAGVSRDRESDKAAIAMAFQDPDNARKQMLGIYLRFVTNDFTIGQYRRFIRLLLEQRDKAVLWHCTAGKDRTGFAAVLIETLLGVDRAAIMADYLSTNTYLAEEVNALCAMVGESMGGLDERTDKALRCLFGAEEAYLAAVYEKADELYGGLDGYITDALGISEDERALFRSRYLA